MSTTAPSPSTPDLDQWSDGGLSRTDNITCTQTLTLTGHSVAGASVTVLDGDAVLGTAIAAANGGWTFRTGKLAEGQHVLSTIVTDSDGNASARSDTLTVTIDTTAPATPPAPDLAAASDWGYSSTDNITDRFAPLTLTGAADPFAEVDIIDGLNGMGASWTTRADATGAWTCQLLGPLLARGLHQFTVTTSDIAGNWSAFSVPLRVTLIDRATAPPAPDLATASDTGVSGHDHLTADATPELTGKVTAGRDVQVFREGSAPGDFEQVGTVRAGADGRWSLTTGRLADGVHDFWIKVLDSAGIASMPSASMLVTVDTTAPAAPAAMMIDPSDDTGASATDGITTQAKPAFSGTAEAGTTVTLYDNGAAIGHAHAAADGTWRIATSQPLAEGMHTVTARATDAAGNEGAAATTRVTIVTPPPAPGAPDLAAASDTGIADADNITRNRTPTLTGQATAGDRIAIHDGDTLLGTVTATATGAWSFRAPTLADGTHAFTARRVAAGGIEGAASSALTVTIDSTAPIAPGEPTLMGADASSLSTRPPSGCDAAINHAQPVLTGAAEARATITVYRGSSVIGTAQADAGGQWSFELPDSLVDGTHGFRVRATDAAGNVSAASARLDVQVDTVAPCAPVISSYAPTRIAGTAEAGAMITLKDGATTLGIALTSSAGTWAVTGDFAGHAFAAMTAVATDRAGNATASAPVAITLGTAGGDALDGGGGPVTLTGGAGDDTYNVDSDTLVLERTGQGTDTILASSDYTLAAGCSIEFLTGTAPGPIVLTGNEQRNTIQGGVGDDTITGGGGRDVLYGGLGADRFVLGALSDSTPDGPGRDIIEDFSAAQGDRLDLSALDADLATPGDQGFAFIGAAAFHATAGELRATSAGGMATVQGDVDGDGMADFAIGLRGRFTLADSDFVL